MKSAPTPASSPWLLVPGKRWSIACRISWSPPEHGRLDPATAQGEYIGVTLIEAQAAAGLADALEAVWRRDPGLYYEDGFQEYADRGGRVGAAPIGTVEWVEVDDHADLARARELACRC